MRFVLPLLASLAVAGCAPMAYQKAGVTTTQASADEQECRLLAARESPMGMWIPGRPFGWGPRPYPFRDPMLYRMQTESGLADFCMRARGCEMKALPSSS